MKMDPEADLGLLEHVRGRIARIGRAHQRGKMTVLRLPLGAGRRNTQTIAKSTQRLTDGIRATEPEVPWRAIAGSRNVLLHGYFEIDLEVVWSVVDEDPPILVAAVDRMAHAARSCQP